ncbi:MAG: LacI family DNA-binding transcriptional regulator [Pseudomonadota bacterium]
MSKRSKSVTLADVAKHAGVGTTTVSRVINGDDASVRPVTRERVRLAINKLNYVPNVSARALAGARHYRVALIYSAEASFSFYLGSLVVNTLDAVTRKGMHMSVIKLPTELSETEKVEQLRDALADVDGFVVPPPLADQQYIRNFLQDVDVPAVFLTGLPGKGRSRRVYIDDFAAAYEMTEHLLSLGHERIGFIRGIETVFESQERERGFKEAHRRMGLSVDENLIGQGNFTYDTALTAADELLARPDRPTAIFASNDEMALACISVANRLGLTVPDDVSVAGFDASPLSVCVTPTLTSVEQPLPVMAEHAVDALANLLQNADETDESQLDRTPVVVAHKLVLGGSTAAPKHA